MPSLTKGANAPVSGPKAMVTVVWNSGPSSAAYEVDISAFMLRDNRKVASDAGMIFYGQRRFANGSVEQTVLDQRGPSGIETKFAIDLAAVPVDIEAIAFTATIGAKFRQTIGDLALLRILVEAGEPVEFVVPTAGATEVALIVGELYRRNDQWKFRAVGQGFNGGLQPLAESMGVVIEAPKASTAPAPTPTPAAPVSAAPPSKPINLSKVTLTKERPSISLEKRQDGFGEVKVNLNWNRGSKSKSSGLKAIFGGGSSGGVDLDIAALFELQDGRIGVVQALGRSMGNFEREPYVHLLGDDRTGSNADGEWLRINGQQWSKIRRVLVYAFIYEGVPNWAATDGVVTVTAPGQAPIEVRLDEGRSGAGTCAVALLENSNGELKVSREVNYFGDAEQMDRHYRWGLRWRAGSKD